MNLSPVLNKAMLFFSGLLALTCVHANPKNGTVVSGSAEIIENSQKLDIYQKTDKAIIDWKKFNIAPDEHTQFHQPSSQSIILNRIKDNHVSKVMGTLTANGNVILINPNGIFFGPNATVDVNGLIATTSDINNQKFMKAMLTSYCNLFFLQII